MAKFQKSVKELGQDALRKKFITDIITNWISSNPQVFELWKKQKKARMENMKTKFGEIKGQGMDFVERMVWSMPADLHNRIEMAFENPRFCEMPDEEKWFIKNFPVFLATEKY